MNDRRHSERKRQKYLVIRYKLFGNPQQQETAADHLMTLTLAPKLLKLLSAR
jgi:hypothetical protein